MKWGNQIGNPFQCTILVYSFHFKNVARFWSAFSYKKNFNSEYLNVYLWCKTQCHKSPKGINTNMEHLFR